MSSQSLSIVNDRRLSKRNSMKENKSWFWSDFLKEVLLLGVGILIILTLVVKVIVGKKRRRSWEEEKKKDE